MKLKSLTKGLLVTAALALTIVTTPASLVKAEGAQGTYTVERNDNLSKIAKKVYGNEKLWKVIYDANSGVVKSNYIIYTGQVLTIPAVNDNSVTTPTPTTPAPTTPTTPTTPAPTTPTTSTPTSTPTPTTPAPTTPAPTTPTQEEEFVLDYNQIASWVTGGFVGIDEAGEAVILGTDSENDYGILIFADDSTMEAASFVGPITYGDDYMTITDEVNGYAWTFGVSENTDGTLVFEFGELGGTTVVVAQPRESILNFIKMAIDGYKLVL